MLLNATTLGCMKASSDIRFHFGTGSPRAAAGGRILFLSILLREREEQIERESFFFWFHKLVARSYQILLSLVFNKHILMWLSDHDST